MLNWSSAPAFRHVASTLANSKASALLGFEGTRAFLSLYFPKTEGVSYRFVFQRSQKNVSLFTIYPACSYALCHYKLFSMGLWIFIHSIVRPFSVVVMLKVIAKYFVNGISPNFSFIWIILPCNGEISVPRHDVHPWHKVECLPEYFIQANTHPVIYSSNQPIHPFIHSFAGTFLGDEFVFAVFRIVFVFLHDFHHMDHSPVAQSCRMATGVYFTCRISWKRESFFVWR